MQVWNVLHAALWKIQDAKIYHLRTIPQRCRAISSQLRHASTIEKKLVKQQYLLHTSSQYGELWPTNDWDRLASLGHPSKYERIWHLGFVIFAIWSTAFNRGRHIHSAGQPLCLASANILVEVTICVLTHQTDRQPFNGLFSRSTHVSRHQ